MVAALGTILTGLGLGTQLFGNFKKAKADALTLEQQAIFDEAAADEMLRRSRINQDIVEEESLRTIGDIEAKIAASGAGLGSASSLLIRENAVKQMVENLETIRSEAEFQAAITRAGAASARGSASDIKRAGLINAFGGTALGVGKFAQAGGFNDLFGTSRVTHNQRKFSPTESGASSIDNTSIA